MAKILLVEDDPAQAAELAATLTRCGHDTRVASDAAEAIGSFLDRRPDIAIVDVHLRERRGNQVADMLLAIDYRVTILLVSADVGALSTIAIDRRSGFTCLPKPLDITKLNAIIGMRQ